GVRIVGHCVGCKQKTAYEILRGCGNAMEAICVDLLEHESLVEGERLTQRLEHDRKRIVCAAQQRVERRKQQWRMLRMAALARRRDRCFAAFVRAIRHRQFLRCPVRHGGLSMGILVSPRRKRLRERCEKILKVHAESWLSTGPCVVFGLSSSLRGLGLFVPADEGDNQRLSLRRALPDRWQLLLSPPATARPSIRARPAAPRAATRTPRRAGR